MCFRIVRDYVYFFLKRDVDFDKNHFLANTESKVVHNGEGGSYNIFGKDMNGSRMMNGLRRGT